nr:hypothetical protein [Chthoniobacterales bacterium]
MRIRVALLLALTVSTAPALTEQKVAEEFDVAPGGRLIVDVDFGSVDVTASGSGKMVVDVYRKIDSSDEAREKEYVT